VTAHRHLHRLARVWDPHAIYFLTICTEQRRRRLAEADVARVLREEWARALASHGWAVGRYVILPDHVHFFCMERPGGADCALSRFVQRWKEWTAKRIQREVLAPRDATGPHAGDGPARHSPRTAPFRLWQRQFFDHVLRSGESYSEKWTYVRENPVRAGLVTRWSDWPFQGCVDFDEPRPMTP